MSVVVTAANFDEVVLKSEKPVLVDFWATWCGPCKMLAPVVEAAAEAHADQLVVGKVDVDQEEELARRFGIMSIPTLILFKDGEKVDTSVGLFGKPQLEALLEKVL